MENSFQVHSPKVELQPLFFLVFFSQVLLVIIYLEVRYKMSALHLEEINTLTVKVCKI